MFKGFAREGNTNRVDGLTRGVLKGGMAGCNWGYGGGRARGAAGGVGGGVSPGEIPGVPGPVSVQGAQVDLLQADRAGVLLAHQGPAPDALVVEQVLAGQLHRPLIVGQLLP